MTNATTDEREVLVDFLLLGGGWHAIAVRQAVKFLPTRDGRVAYSVVGSGPPLVCVLSWVSHLGLLWDSPSHRRFVETLARQYTVIVRGP